MKMKTLNFNGQTFDINDDGAARYDESQRLNDDEKAKARENIGAAAVGEGGGSTGTIGPQGPQGEKGEDGTSVTVTNISESTEDGGSNVVTFSDGNTLTVKNGSKGNPGEKGDKGDTGAQGPQGEPGTNASVTSESVKEALGYVPAAQNEVFEYTQIPLFTNLFDSVEIEYIMHSIEHGNRINAPTPAA